MGIKPTGIYHLREKHMKTKETLHTQDGENLTHGSNTLKENDFYDNEKIEYSLDNDEKYISIYFSMYGHKFSDFRLPKILAKSMAEDILEICTEK